jgi:hypothetical protein
MWSLLLLSVVVCTPVVCCGLYSCCLMWSVLFAICCGLCSRCLLWSLLLLSTWVCAPVALLWSLLVLSAVLSAPPVCCRLCSSCLLSSMLLLSCSDLCSCCLAVVYAPVVLLWSLLVLSAVTQIDKYKAQMRRFKGISKGTIKICGGRKTKKLLIKEV